MEPNKRVEKNQRTVKNRNVKIIGYARASGRDNFRKRLNLRFRPSLRVCVCPPENIATRATKSPDSKRRTRTKTCNHPSPRTARRMYLHVLRVDKPIFASRSTGRGQEGGQECGRTRVRTTEYGTNVRRRMPRKRENRDHRPAGGIHISCAFETAE